jgi:hypothetical protein
VLTCFFAFEDVFMAFFALKKRVDIETILLVVRMRATLKAADGTDIMIARIWARNLMSFSQAFGIGLRRRCDHYNGMVISYALFAHVGFMP